MRLISGIKVHGTRIRIRKESKVALVLSTKPSDTLLEQIWTIHFIKLTLCLLFVMSVEWFVEQSTRPVYLGK